MALQIGGTAIPASMNYRGLSYRFEPPRVVRKNGQGLAVTAGAARLTWTWAYITQTEWNWWYTALLTGLASKEFTGTGTTRLYNDLNVETAYNHCIVFRPVAETVLFEEYRNVTVQIEQIY